MTSGPCTSDLIHSCFKQPLMALTKEKKELSTACQHAGIPLHLDAYRDRNWLLLTEILYS